MGWRTGVNRINLVIRWISYLLAVGAAIPVVFAWAEGRTLNDALVGSAILLVLAAVTWLSAWIVSGFTGVDGDGRVASPRPRSGLTAQAIAIRWAIVFTGLVIGGVIVTREGGSYDAGRLFGQVIIFLFVLAVIGRLLDARAPTTAVTRFGPAIVFSVGVVMWATHLYLEQVEQKAATVAAVQEARALLSAPAPITDNQAARPRQQTSASKNVTAEVFEISRSARSRMESAMTQYQSRVDAANIGGLLAYESLAYTDGRAKGVVTIKQLDDSVSKVDGDIRAVFEAMERDMQRIRDESADGAAAYDGYRKTLPASRQLMEDWIGVEHRFFRTMLALYRFLGDPDVAYNARDGRIYFQNPAHLQKYQGYFKTIEEVGQAESEVQRRMLASHQQAQKNLDDMLLQAGAKPVIGR